MLAAALLALMIIQASVPEPPFAERLKAAASRDIVDVPVAVTVIEEKELPRDAVRSQADVQPTTSNRSTLGSTGLTDMSDRGQRGMRLLAFRLEPKEKLIVKLVGQDPEKIQLSLAPPAQQGPMSSEIGMVNKRPAFQRSRNLPIRNVTDQPFTVLLRVTGFLGYAYKLEIQREK